MTRRAVRLAIAGGALLAPGCYSYQNMAGREPVPRTEISVTLTDSGSVALAAEVGPRVRTLKGKVLEVTPDIIRLEMIETTDFRGMESLWRGEPVSVPRRLTASMDQRQFSLWRTVVTAAGGVALVVVAGVAIGEAGSSGSGKPGDPPK